MIFYLDDYRLIQTKDTAEIANGDLAIFVDDKKIDYELKLVDNNLEILLKEDYKENLKVYFNGTNYPILPRFITHTRRFEEEYRIDLKQLGSFYNKEKTIFRLWSPLSLKAYVVLNDKEYKMDYLSGGLYELVIEGDFDLSLYHYKVLRDKYYEFNDPFSILNKDNNNSYVIDINKLLSERIHPEDYKNISIYETSVRDFSSDKNVSFKYPKKFLGLIEEGLKLDGQEVGFDYLKGLGISHLQLMPVFSFDLDSSDYNWGYNPTSFNSLENSYFVSENPYEQLNEFILMINTLHKNNIRVNLDVVYNHVYRVNEFNLEKMLPYYFFRYKDGKIGNASYCGNETRSEAYFLHEYLKLLCKRFVKLFDIDGLRFDIMGILDIDTINDIKQTCKSIKPDFLIYGEGWDMGDILIDSKKAMMANCKELKNVAFFNDVFRNTLRGRDINDADAYLLGKTELKENVKNLLSGSLNMGFDLNQSINYVECHDNFTLYDKLSRYDIDIINVTKLALALTILSRGLPFIHSGIEFLRTKKGIDNSYNCDDDINLIDWQRKNKYIEVSEYFKALLRLRKSLNYYFNDDLQVEFIDYYEVLIYKVENLYIFINPCIFKHIYVDGNEYEIIFNTNGFTKIVTDGINIDAFSIVVAYKR
ncbi:MAG: hypothetical protein IJH31_07140 [Erysipelotrichaceae bacterium]|nr:hypothetical protein [Erysipelotrichaceae bacterium]